MKTYLNEQHKLRQPLGTWLTTYHKHRFWKFTTDGVNLINHQHKRPSILYKKEQTRTRQRVIYKRVRITWKTFDHSCLPVTPITVTDDVITCKFQEIHLHEYQTNESLGNYKIYSTNDPIPINNKTESLFIATIRDTRIEVT
jgi:hypothetical protein